MFQLITAPISFFLAQDFCKALEVGTIVIIKWLISLL